MAVHRSAWLAGALTAGALGLRALYLASFEHANPFRADAAEYARYAANLVYHSTYSRAVPSTVPLLPDAFRPPGYPLFLAACLWLFGDPAAVRWVYALQALLSAALVPGTLILGRRFLPRWAAWIAAVLVALSPHLISFTGYLLTELLFAFCLLLGLIAFQLALAARRPAGLFATGVLFGAGSLVNSAATPIALLAAVSLLFERPLRRSHSIDWLRHPDRRGIAALLIGAALLPGLWSLRNAGLPPESRGGGDRLLATAIHGSYPGFVYRDPRLRYYAYREDPRFREMLQSHRDFARVMSERIRERPLRYLLWYAVEKPITLWTWNMLQGVDDVYVYPLDRYGFAEQPLLDGIRIAMKGLHPLILLVALAGIPVFASRQRALREDRVRGPMPRLLLLLFGYWTFLYTLTAPWPRYAIPLRPELFLWVAFALSRLPAAFAARRSEIEVRSA